MTTISSMKIIGFAICVQGSNRLDVIIGSDNGLSPNRWQAILWTNDGLVYWRIYAYAYTRLLAPMD